MKEKMIHPCRRRGRRNVFCPSYSKCLDLVIGKGWRTWNCAKCDQRFDEEAEIPLNVNDQIPYYEVSTEI